MLWVGFGKHCLVESYDECKLLRQVVTTVEFCKRKELERRGAVCIN
jgi:hypothetical protein